MALLVCKNIVVRSVSLDDGKRDNESYFTDEIEEEAVKELVSPSLLFF